MLDDDNVLKQRDPQGMLAAVAEQWRQAEYDVEIRNGQHDGRQLTRVVVAGMGDSILAALIIKAWLGRVMKMPIEVVRDYDLPGYVDASTLVIACSYSGNTKETLSSFAQAKERGAEIAVVTGGGQLLEGAAKISCAHVVLPSSIRPRMAMIYNLRSLLAILANFGIIDASMANEVTGIAEWLKKESAFWNAKVSTAKNEAKQFALLAIGKTPVVFGGPLTGVVAYKWKINWNENAKNTAFWNEYPEFNYTEFVGWSSHPIEKPFIIFDLISDYEHPQILKQFKAVDKLLSGKRPKANVIKLKGATLLEQLLWGCLLADFTSIYVAILNGVDPTPVSLIEKLGKELA